MPSLLFAPLAWDLPEDKTTAASTSSTGTSTAESTTTPSWPKSEPSAPAGRWRINSGDLEEMMRVASSGLDSTSRSASAPLLEDTSSSNIPPLSREDFVEERGESVVGFPLSRGSSPLYRKQQQLHQQQQQHNNYNHHAGCSDSSPMDHQLDTTAPSSPCTPSLHMRGTSGTLSAVSPTSSRSDEVAFQQQLSLEADSRAAAAPISLSARPSSGSPSGGRFGLKLLVSNSMAGTLIGKGGTRICEIKDEVSSDFALGILLRQSFPP